MVRTVCRRLRTSERLSRFVEALTRHHLVLGFLVHERPLDRRQVYRYLTRTSPVEVEVTLLSCADRLATGGRNAERAIEAHLELARELMEAALDWREHGSAAAAAPRATSWPRSWASGPGPSWAACSASWRRPPTPGRRARATRPSSWPVGFRIRR